MIDRHPPKRGSMNNEGKASLPLQELLEMLFLCRTGHMGKVFEMQGNIDGFIDDLYLGLITVYLESGPEDRMFFCQQHEAPVETLRVKVWNGSLMNHLIVVH